MKLAFLSTLSLLLLASCSGRLSDSNSQSVDFSQFDLKPGTPAVISFGALWCKPCREEINSFNRLSKDFNSRVQIVEYLVEGQIEGSLPSAGDPERFTSKEGERANYRLELDPRWEKFQSFQPPKKALPLVVLLDGAGNVQALVQRSMDYEDELKPWVERILSGLQPIPTPTPPPAIIQRTVKYAEWVSETTEHAPGTEIDRNFRAAWQKGLEKFAFDPTTMPFEESSIGEKKMPGEENFQLSSATWTHDTCVLIVSLKPNGEYVKAIGHCD